MAKSFELKTISDNRGDLNVIEAYHEVPFQIKRVFYIHNVPLGSQRGGHRHIKNQLALICLNGSCDIVVGHGVHEKTYHLDRPSLCLLLDPSDWHIMKNFSDKAVLLVLASEYYNTDDYIYKIQQDD